MICFLLFCSLRLFHRDDFSGGVWILEASELASISLEFMVFD